MKKILGISLVALFTAMPMLAKAEGEPSVTAAVPGATIAANDTAAREAATASNGAIYSLQSAAGTDGALATGGYVKGAYNAAMKAINKVSVDAKSYTDSAISAVNTTTESLAGRLTTAETNITNAQSAINTLNGASNVEGSVDYKIAAALTSVTSDATALTSRVTTIESTYATKTYADSAADAAEVAAKSYADGLAANYDAAGAAAAAETAAKAYADGLAANYDAAGAAASALNDAKTYTDSALTAYTNTTGMNSAIASAVASEATTRASADSALGSRIDALQSAMSGDYAAKTGVISTINASTVPVLTVWGDSTASTIAVSAPASYVEPQSASQEG